MTVAITPQDLGLPFADWRPGQLTTARAIVASRKRFIVLSLPTGVGKSAIYLAAARLMQQPSAVLTATKGLQDQLVRDYAGDETDQLLVDIRGMANYPCQLLKRDATCADGPCLMGERCQFREHGCDYYDQLRYARAHDAIVTNYAYWIMSHEYSNGLGQRGLLICDEAHEIRDWLINVFTVRLSAADVTEYARATGLPAPRTTVWSAWSEWAAQCVSLLQSAADPELPAYQRIAVLSAVDHTWHIEKTKGGWLFGPTTVQRLAHKLWLKTPRVVLASATITRHALAMLGIHEGDYDWIECEHPFPVENRPVLYRPIAKVSRNTTEYQMMALVSRVDTIIEDRIKLGRSGIVHTASYQRAAQVLQHSRYSDCMITHTSSRELPAAIAKFRTAKSPVVLVSPSVMTGVDFPGDLARWHVMLKLPFPNLADAHFAAQLKREPRLSDHCAATALVQAYGRAVRGPDDWAEFIVVDGNGQWFMMTDYAKRQFPRWFTAAVRDCSRGVLPLMKEPV